MAARIRIEFDRPPTCGKCPFYSETTIVEHGPSYQYITCGLGFISGDLNVRTKSYQNAMYPHCRLNRYAVPVSEYKDDYYIKPSAE